jgi:hypothetical protein
MSEERLGLKTTYSPSILVGASTGCQASAAAPAPEVAAPGRNRKSARQAESGGNAKLTGKHSLSTQKLNLERRSM